jgi:hypothetical protein
MSAPDLFGNPTIPDGPAMTLAERKREQRRIADRPRGHYAPPGTGPAGETCGSCAHSTRIEYHNRAYWKCLRAQHRWSHSIGTDIRLKSDACIGWGLEPTFAESDA